VKGGDDLLDVYSIACSMADTNVRHILRDVFPNGKEVLEVMLENQCLTHGWPPSPQDIDDWFSTHSYSPRRSLTDEEAQILFLRPEITFRELLPGAYKSWAQLTARERRALEAVGFLRSSWDAVPRYWADVSAWAIINDMLRTELSRLGFSRTHWPTHRGMEHMYVAVAARPPVPETRAGRRRDGVKETRWQRDVRRRKEVEAELDRTNKHRREEAMFKVYQLLIRRQGAVMLTGVDDEDYMAAWNSGKVALVDTTSVARAERGELPWRTNAYVHVRNTYSCTPRALLFAFMVNATTLGLTTIREVREQYEFSYSELAYLIQNAHGACGGMLHVCT
jgi:hypothetical protein